MWASDLRLSARALGLTAALLASAQALAQNPPVITDADIERVRREQPAITEGDIDAARRKYSMPGDAELRYAPVPIPNVEALPQPLSRTPIDLERGHELDGPGGVVGATAGRRDGCGQRTRRRGSHPDASTAGCAGTRGRAAPSC